MTPFYETSRKEHPEDYRPVSVTLVLGSHGADRLECIIGQVQDNQVIGPNQNGSVTASHSLLLEKLSACGLQRYIAG